jgi:hypothetical protein
MDYIPVVVQTLAGVDYTIYIYFDDGSVRLYDAEKIVNSGGVFEPLKDKEFFREHLTVLNHTVAWDMDGTRSTENCIDLDPITLYETCPVVKDPLEIA